MTTRVLIVAGHGWPVDVTKRYYYTQFKEGIEERTIKEETVRIPANTIGDLIVFDGLDLTIHEVQPYEIEKEIDKKSD